MTLKLTSTSIKLSVLVQSSAGFASAKTVQSQAKWKEKRQEGTKANAANVGCSARCVPAPRVRGLVELLLCVWAQQA